MKIRRGTVVDGRIIVEGERLPEGATVTVVDESDEEPYPLSPEQEAALEEADQEIERGDCVTVARLLADMQRARG